MILVSFTNLLRSTNKHGRQCPYFNGPSSTTGKMGPWRQYISFLYIWSIFSVIQISLPNFEFFTVKSPTLLKDRFLKKMLLKRAKLRRIFFAKLQAQIILIYYSNWKQFQVFKIGKFEFKVTVGAYGQNAPSCDPLNHYPSTLTKRQSWQWGRLYWYRL